MPTVRQTMGEGRKNVLKWIANSYNADIPIIGNVGQRLSPYVNVLRDVDMARDAGVSDDILRKVSQGRNVHVSGRAVGNMADMDVPGVQLAARTGNRGALMKALDSSHMTRIKMGAGLGAIIGGVTGALDEDKSVFGTAARYGVEGALFETFFPTMQYLYMTSAVGQIGASVAGNISRAGAERLHHVMSGRGLYSQSDPTQNQFAGNIRRQSMGYMIQSKQNTKSFIGSEATYMHGVS